MCGIVGFTGTKEAYKMVYRGLCRLEYRGYDSAGVAYNEDGKIKIFKNKGRVKDVLSEETEIVSDTVIGHTRWATHGSPSETNAHPHMVGRVCVVHNGIIENYNALKLKLAEKGYTFVSETDTEVACALISNYYDLTNDPLKSISCAIGHFQGSFALCVIFSDIPGVIFATRSESPLILIPTNNFVAICSDFSAVSSAFDRHYIPERAEIARIEGADLKVYDTNGKEKKVKLSTIGYKAKTESENKFSSYMELEISEQPKILDGIFKRNDESFSRASEILKESSVIHMIACGTAYNAALTSKSFFTEMAGVQVYCHLASEFRYSGFALREDDAYIVISQSGETADTIASMRFLQKNCKKVIGVVNAEFSTIDREADVALHTDAGQEFSVASTKGFTSQVAVLFRMAFEIANDRQKAELYKEIYCRETKRACLAALENTEAISRVSRCVSGKSSSFYIGRQTDYALAKEGSLKLKEITYIHSEAVAAGELKHGTLSLIEKETPVIAIITDENVREKTESNIEEVMARGGNVFCIAKEQDMPKCVRRENRIVLPYANFPTTVFAASVVLQRIALTAATLLGRDIDKPRNLAKSVTVE